MIVSPHARLELIDEKSIANSLLGIQRMLKVENFERKKLKRIKRELKFILQLKSKL
jgi:hypothetical protein